jgi:TPR repeat protein
MNNGSWRYVLPCFCELFVLDCGIRAAEDAMPPRDRFSDFAKVNYGTSFYDIKGTPVAIIKQDADNGDANAQFNYACCLHKGEGVAADNIAAKRYYKLASDQGHMLARFNYACCLFFDTGNKEEAVHYFRQLARQGYVDAQLNYGLCLHNGEGANRCEEMAARALKRAADKGNATAARYYAEYLQEQGKCATVSKIEKLQHLLRSADWEQPASFVHLTDCDGTPMGESIPVNEIEVERYLQLAVDQGDAEALFQFGERSYNGNGVPKDIEKAARYYQKAAEQGHRWAKLEYGR